MLFGRAIQSYRPYQLGVLQLHTTTKKKALADVGNTLHQRNSVKGSGIKEQLFKIKRNETVNDLVKNVTQVTVTSDAVVIAEDLNVTGCSCPENPVIEDDYADILFKNIRLTKSQIEDLAMEWEHPPVYSKADKRELDLPEEALFEIDYDLINMRWSKKSLYVVDDFEVPPPYFEASFENCTRMFESC